MLVLVYLLLPELGARRRLRRPLLPAGSRARALALTFDDGPDAERTPAILAILRQEGVPATFFCLGRRVDAHPDLVRAIAAAGHDLGTHGQSHRHAWCLHPRATVRDIREGQASLERVLGVAPTLYRPPWGRVNLVTLPAAHRAGLTPVLYDVEGRDWLPGDQVANILAAVTGRAHPGAVVLLHDGSAGGGAGDSTVRALPELIRRLRAEGYSFLRVTEMLAMNCTARAPQPARLFRLWLAWERLFARLAGVLAVTDTIHVAPYRYRGGPRELAGTAVLRRGDRCLDLHFHNLVLAHECSQEDATGSAAAFMRHLSADLGSLADLLAGDPRFADVRALTATTLFHQPARRLGFRAEEVRSRWRRGALSWYMKVIRRIYAWGLGQAPSGRLGAREVRFVWVTREEFMARFHGAGRDN